MVPTKRLFLLFALGIPVAIFAGFVGSYTLFWAYNLTCLLVAAITYYLAPSTKDLRLRRRHDPVLSVRVPNHIELEMENDGVETITGILREEPPPFFSSDRQEFDLAAEPGRLTTFTYRLTPNRRGTEYFRGTYIRLNCPLGLVQRDIKLPTEAPIRVYPNVLALREFDLLKQKGKLRDIGVRISRIKGLGTEFESLRDYADGDDFRKIDWKASARRSKLIVRQFEQERNQPVIVAIDVGRKMLSEVNGVTKLDHTLDSLLMLLHAAVKEHDQIGLLVYSDRVVRYIAPRKGNSQMRVIIDAIHDLIAEPVESDPVAAFAYLASRWKRRALIVAFTDAETEEDTKTLAVAMSSLARRHIALVARVADPRLAELAGMPISEPAALYAKASAIQFTDERKRSATVLETFNINNLEAEPQDLAAALVSFYFVVKERGLL